MDVYLLYFKCNVFLKVLWNLYWVKERVMRVLEYSCLCIQLCVYSFLCVQLCVYSCLCTTVCVYSCVYTAVCVQLFVYTAVCIQLFVYSCLYIAVCIQLSVYSCFYTVLCVQLFVYSCLIRENYGPNNIKKFSPYRAVNTLRLSYKNQPVNVVQWNNRCLFWDPHKKHKYTVWAQGRIG